MYHQTKGNTKIVTGKLVQAVPLAMEKQEIKIVNAYIS